MRFAESAYTWREAGPERATVHGRAVAQGARRAGLGARRPYMSGQTGFADLLDAERTLLEYHMEATTAQGEREMAMAEMSLMIMGRWPENVEQLAPGDAARTGSVK